MVLSPKPNVFVTMDNPQTFLLHIIHCDVYLAQQTTFLWTLYWTVGGSRNLKDWYLKNCLNHYYLQGKMPRAVSEKICLFFHLDLSLLFTFWSMVKDLSSFWNFYKIKSNLCKPAWKLHKTSKEKKQTKNRAVTNSELQTTNLDVWELVATCWFSILGHAFNLARKERNECRKGMFLVWKEYRRFQSGLTGWFNVYENDENHMFRPLQFWIPSVPNHHHQNTTWQIYQ